MKTFCFRSLGAGLESLVAADRPEPVARSGEVVIKILARSLNFRDLRILAGLYPVPGRDGCVALSDGAGEVVTIGAGVTRFAVGDRVALSYFPRWTHGRFQMAMAGEQFGCTRDGVLAELAAANEQEVVRVPDNLTYEEAATLPCAGVTAWSALAGPRPIVPGETVMTIGSGGVALFALQFAKAHGARVIAVTSRDSNVHRLKALGADEAVSTQSHADWPVQVRRMTAGRGVEHVVETGSLDTLPLSIACAAEEAVVSIVSAINPGAIDARLFASPITMRRVYVGNRDSFEAMNRAIGLLRIRPVIDRVFAFGDAISAYRHFEERTHVGKIVIGEN